MLFPPEKAPLERLYFHGPLEKETPLWTTIIFGFHVHFSQVGPNQL